MSDFHLVDLIAQRDAVRAHLRGRSGDEIVEWLSHRGRLDCEVVAGRPVYYFESAAGLKAVFFVRDAELVFVGDHITFT